MTVAESVIHRDPEIQGGVPVFEGTRVPIRNLIDYLEAGDTLEAFLDAFPSVSREQAIAASGRGRCRTRGHLRVLLDESLPRQLADELREYEVATVQSAGVERLAQWRAPPSGRRRRVHGLCHRRPRHRVPAEFSKVGRGRSGGQSYQQPHRGSTPTRQRVAFCDPSCGSWSSASGWFLASFDTGGDGGCSRDLPFRPGTLMAQ